MGDERALASTQSSHLLHQEAGKAMRELGLEPDAQSRAFSNFLLPLGAEGPMKPGHRKGGNSRVRLEISSW